MNKEIFRDTLEVKINDQESLIIAVDNSGSIGEKEADDVLVPYDVVGYYSLRVAIMECIAAGGTPMSVVVHNFSGDLAWEAVLQGVKRGLKELSIDKIEVVGSTESNFSMLQSATGIIVIGKKINADQIAPIENPDKNNLKVAVIGQPLVGNDVVEKANMIAPLQLFKWCSEQEYIKTILPVGSKGILQELKLLFGREDFLLDEKTLNEIDLHSSGGPSTCFIIVYESHLENTIKNKASTLFTELHFEK